MADYLPNIGTVFAEFRSDNGNVSFGVEDAGRRYFVKTAGDPLVARHDERVAELRNAARLASHLQHRALAGLERVIESPTGPLLIYR